MTYQNAMNTIENFYQSKEKITISKPFTYIVPMFPYPSGNIHMGHVRNYTITNAISQYMKIQGQSVIHPIGFDAFGLPAENAAIKNGRSPHSWTEDNIAKMKSDFNAIGFDFDWQASIQTNDPQYYSFEQDIFRQAWRQGLIYKKEQYVNYDPIDHTVLSNEQVINGKGWRTNADIVRKKIPMYFFNMKKYAKELFDGLNEIKPHWPSQVIEMQKNWIDYQVGTYHQIEINHFMVDVFEKNSSFNTIIMGINHPFVQQYQNDHFSSWLSDNEKGSVSQKNSFKDKKYYDTGFYYEYNQIQIPIFIDLNADDECIFIASNVSGSCQTPVRPIQQYEGEFIGLKDWCISRQRYWGNPIPVIHCDHCGDVIDDHFVELPTDLIPKTGNVLESTESFKDCSCPICHSKAHRITDTMDTFVQSSWYFHAYITKYFGANHGITHPDTQIDYYVGGIEHATMHLIYARFFHKMLRDFGYVNTNEPIKKLITQGMVCKKYMNAEGKTVSAKMSKSIGNIVEPQSYIDQYGSDALQMFMIFAAPPHQNFDFDDSGIIGCHRFLDDIYRYFFIENASQKTYSQEQAQQTVIKMQSYFDKEFNGRFNLNTLIPQLMTAFKIIKKTKFESEVIQKEVERTFVRYLGIFAPKISHYIECHFSFDLKIKSPKI